MLYCTECPLRDECVPLKRHWEEGYKHPLEPRELPDWSMDACPLYAIMKVSEES